MPSRSARRSTMTLRSSGVGLLAFGILTGCSGSGPSGRGVDPGEDSPVDEMAAHDGKVCPQRLPRPEDPGGFGTEGPAESSPSLPDAESAWVCRYDTRDAGTGPDGQGTSMAWVRAGTARPVDPSQVPVLERGLGELTPAPGERLCTADIGPRWMLVLSRDGDLTGVVVDDYGCRDVRLTDEPFETVPGDATQPGTVPGVLAGPTDLLADIKDAHAR